MSKVVLYNEAEYPSLRVACESLGLSYLNVYRYVKRHNMTYDEVISLFMSNGGVAPSVLPSFTAEEDALIVQKYQHSGGNIPELLSKYTKKQIMSRARSLGVSRISDSEWTDEDISLLRKLYCKKGMDIPELLSKFTPTQIQYKARKCDLLKESDSWTDTELKLLIENYKLVGSNIPELLKTRGARSIRKKAESLGISIRDDILPWTDDEISVLREAYSRGIRPVLPGRNAVSVTKKARALGLQSLVFAWSAEEEEILRANYLILTFEQIAALLPGRTKTAVSNKIRQLGLRSRHEDCGKTTQVGCFCYVQCKVCKKVFLVRPIELCEFSHKTHGVHVPDGWSLPTSYRNSLE